MCVFLCSCVFVLALLAGVRACYPVFVCVINAFVCVVFLCVLLCVCFCACDFLCACVCVYVLVCVRLCMFVFAGMSLSGCLVRRLRFTCVGCPMCVLVCNYVL